MYRKSLKARTTVSITWNILVYPPIYYKPQEVSPSNDSGGSVSQNRPPSFHNLIHVTNSIIILLLKKCTVTIWKQKVFQLPFGI